MNIKTHNIPESLFDFQDMIATRKSTIYEIVSLYLQIIELKDKDINAYIEVYKEEALQKAKEADDILIGKTEDEIRSYFWRHKLFGIPFSVKNNILIEGKRITAGSKILENYKASYTATAVKKLFDQGAICIGSVNMDEFAMGGSTENSAYGVTKNPLNIEYVSGGSSGGSAASLVMDTCLFSLGSDTGGSVRGPASFCGTMGFKPTYGSISRHGLIAMASSFDVIGIFAKTVEDVEYIFETMKGKDELDSTSHDSQKHDIFESIGRKDIKVGVPRDIIFRDGVSDEVKKSIEKTIEKLNRKNIEVIDITVPLFEYALAMYYILVPAEVSSNMARFDGIRYGERLEGKDLLETYFKTKTDLLGNEVKRRIMLGTYILSEGYSDAYYKKALILRKKLKEQIEEIMKKVDVIITPTTPNTAFKIGEKITNTVELYLADIYTVVANLAGLPAISVPYVESRNEYGDVNFGTENKMPLGIQIMGKKDAEIDVFSIAKYFQ